MPTNVIYIVPVVDLDLPVDDQDVPTVYCRICQTDVPAWEFKQHWDDHERYQRIVHFLSLFIPNRMVGHTPRCPFHLVLYETLISF